MPSKTIFLSSSQAASKDLAHGSATWQFRNPLQFSSAELGLFEFSFTNFFVNISTSLGNNHIFVSNDSANLTQHDFTIPDGYYSVGGLSEFLLAEQQSVLGVQVFTLVANYSTSKIGIQFANVTGWFVHFGAASPCALMGFAQDQNVPSNKTCTAYYIEYAANTAAFNNTTALKVSMDLTTDTVSNGEGSSIIYQTSPIVDPGNTQSDHPQQILWCGLTVPSFSQINVRILDQNDLPAHLSEDFTLTVCIKY